MQIDSTASRLAAAGVAFAPQIADAARRHGLDPRLLAAVAAQETGGPGANAGRNVVGDGGHGHGVFQIDDRWHAFAGTAAAMDPAANADYAAGMLSGLLQRYGDVRQALSAYNSGNPHGAGTATRWADGSTLGYADSVLRHYTQLGGPGLPPAATPPEEAANEIGALVASMNALPSMAGSLPPLPPPQSGGGQQPQKYQPQATDYAQAFGSADDG